MAQSQCLRIPLNPQHAPAFVEWIRSLRSRPEAVAAALADEGMLAELVFVEQGPRGTALILYTRAEDLAEANRRFMASTHAVDVEMRSWQARALNVAEASVLEVVLEHGVG